MTLRELIAGLRPSELRLLFTLSHGDFSFSQLRYFAFGGSVSDATIWHALNHLMELGLIEVEEKSGPRNKPRKFYRLKEHIKREVKRFIKDFFELGRDVGITDVVEGLIEAKRFIDDAASFLPERPVKKGKKYVIVKLPIAPRESIGIFNLLLLIYRFFSCINKAYAEPLKLEGYAERLKHDFVELMNSIVEIDPGSEEGRLLMCFLDWEMRRARGMLFAFLFLLQDYHSLPRGAKKKMKKFFSPPKPKKVKHSRPMTGLDLAALLAASSEEGEAAGAGVSSPSEDGESAGRPQETQEGGGRCGKDRAPV